MSARVFRYLRLACCCCFLSRMAAAEPLTDLMRREDGRLEKKVTLTTLRIQVGDLLERLSAQTGVSLAANERDGAADDEICVFLRDAPLFDVLNGLWSLESYREATWNWEREGDPGAYHYRLTRPLTARNLPAVLRQQVQAALEAEAALCVAALRMTPEELKRAVKKEPRLKGVQEHPIQRAAINVLFNTLPPEQRDRLLREDGTFFRLPLDRLSAPDRAVIEAEWHRDKHYRMNEDGVWSEMTAPAAVHISRQRFLPDGSVPAVLMEIEDMGSGGGVGGPPLMRATNDSLADRWLLPGDSAESRVCGRTVPRQDQPQPSLSENSLLRTVLERRLAELADRTPLAMIARLPEVRGVGAVTTPSPDGMKVGEFLKRIGGLLTLFQSKWRGDVLLMTYPGWFQDVEDRVPWAFVKQLRRSVETHEGRLTPEDLGDAAGLLSVRQLQRLAETWPMMHVVSMERDLLALRRTRPAAWTQLRTPTGLPLSEAAEVLQNDMMLKAALMGAGGRAVAVRLRPHTYLGTPLLEVELLAADGSPLSGHSIGLLGRRWP